MVLNFPFFQILISLPHWKFPSRFYNGYSCKPKDPFCFGPTSTLWYISGVSCNLHTSEYGQWIALIYCLFLAWECFHRFWQSALLWRELSDKEVTSRVHQALGWMHPQQELSSTPTTTLIPLSFLVISCMFTHLACHLHVIFSYFLLHTCKMTQVQPRLRPGFYRSKQISKNEVFPR